MLNVLRETPRDKLISLTNYKDDIYKEIELNYNLKYQNTLFNYKLPITSESCNQVKNIASFISFTIIILIFVIVAVEHDLVEQISEFSYYSGQTRFWMQFVCLVQLIFTIVYFFLFLKMRLPLALQKWRDANQADSV